MASPRARTDRELQGMVNPMGTGPALSASEWFHELRNLYALLRGDQEIGGERGRKSQGLILGGSTRTGSAKDQLDDEAKDGSLGMGDEPGSPLMGSQTSGNTSEETATTTICVPGNYTKGGKVAVKLRAKTQPATKSSKVDLAAKKVGAGENNGLGPDLVQTDPQDLTGTYQDYKFELNPQGLEPGDVLVLEVKLTRDDTGGQLSGAPSIIQAGLEFEAFG
jgi:hypothetical protein